MLKDISQAIIGIAFLLFSTTALAQAPRLQEILIDETVPDLELKMLNYSKPTLRFSELKGKVVILDFWSTWCSICIRQLPIFARLQTQYKKDLFILPVGFDGNENNSISKFVAKRIGSDQEIKLPVAIQSRRDTALMALFPFQGLPHEVWIGKDGKLLAITDHQQVTKENIEKILSGKPNPLTQKEFDKSFDKRKPLFLDGNGGEGNKFITRSLITPYIRGIASVESKSSDTSGTRLFMSNTPLPYLFKTPYQKLDTSIASIFEFDYLNKRLLIETKQRSLFKNWPKEEQATAAEIDSFKKKYLFTYELILPPSFSLPEAYKIMLQDLQTAFRINSGIEKRRVKCLSLVRTSSDDKIKSTIKNNQPYQFNHNNDSVSFKNISLSLFIRYFNMHFDMPLIVDNTDYTGNVSLEMEMKDQTLPTLREALRKYDLDLVETEREIEMIVLKDRPI